MFSFSRCHVFISSPHQAHLSSIQQLHIIFITTKENPRSSVPPPTFELGIDIP
jgi:hypothetical protein